MGVNEELIAGKDEGKPGTVELNVPRAYSGLLIRIMRLGSGVHLLHVVKTKTGKFGLVGWQVTEGSRLEKPKE